MRHEPEIQRELERVTAEYQRREATAAPLGRYSLFDDAALLHAQSLERALLHLFKRCDFTALATKQILDVGCGGGGHLRRLVEYGAQPEHLFGIDLMESRIAQARARNPVINWRVGSAHQLPYPDASFDLITSFVVFSSVLSQRTRRLIADEMWRVRKPGGLIICYDFVYANPRNPAVRGISRRHLKELFGRPAARFAFRATTLAPPLARLIAPRARWLADILEQLRIFNTHLLAAITRDEPAHAPNTPLPQ
jgi:ubiquinone/menaquinone biosynthesis C-methylase UbiE